MAPAIAEAEATERRWVPRAGEMVEVVANELAGTAAANRLAAGAGGDPFKHQSNYRAVVLLVHWAQNLKSLSNSPGVAGQLLILRPRL